MKKYVILGMVFASAIVFAIISTQGADTPSNTPLSQEEMRGIHIMPNGAVMRPDGVEIENATILENGSVRLPDGQVVMPAMDYRHQ